MRYLFLCLTTLLCLLSIKAQHLSCGHLESTNQAYLRQHLAAPAAEPRTDEFVPLSFRLIGDDNGNDLARLEDIYDAVCQTNTYFEGSGLQFYVKDIDNPFNGEFFGDDPLGNPQLFELIDDSLAIDVYVTEYGPNLFFPSGYGSATSLQYDVILIDNDFLNGESFSLAHQLGHFFRLLHPYTGWLGLNPSDFTDYYDPTGMLPAISMLPNGFETELVDGSNCESTGDGICDTPPDFLFGAEFPGCPSGIRILDANGDSIPWTPGNIMGSFLDCDLDQYYFSPQQQQVMLTDFLSPEREYLRQLPSPTVGTITGTPSPIFPVEGEVTCGEEFYWTSAGNDISYLVQLSLTPNFQLNLQEYIANDTTLILDIEELMDDRTYYWRVRPLSLGLDCSSVAYSPVVSFYRDVCNISSTTTIPDSHWKVVPNPISEGQHLAIEFQAENAGELDIVLFNAQGFRIFLQKRKFRYGLNRFTISKPHLPAGVYFLQLEDGRRHGVKRLIVHH